ncbi:MAG TPA: zinc-ribbon domain-containing protein [Blastocatellia bacterium]|nr:zinc-ribbon domain-containing protein [Blastocatellia bacterium]
MHNCPACGYESPVGARFCRQCGAMLAGETDFTEASTRNFGRQTAPPPATTVASAPLPPSISDAVSSNTARYPQAAPPQPAYQAPVWNPPVANTASLRPRRRLLKWGGWALALLLSAGIGASINRNSYRNYMFVSQADRARLEQLRLQDRINQTMTDSVIEQQERAKDELERRMDEIERASREAERAAERGLTAATADSPLDLSEYEYPGATAGQYSRIPGRELLTQRTRDDFATVSQFYQQKLGRPVMQTLERNRQQALFQSPGKPAVAVLVREGRDRSRQPEITIIRSPFNFPWLQPNQPEPKTEADQKAAEPKARVAP